MSLLRHLLCLLSAVVLLPGATAAVSDNFDQSPLGKFPASWRPYQTIDPANGVVTVVPDNKGRAVRIETRGVRDANAVGMTRSFSARPDQAYRVSVEIRNADPKVTPKVGFNLIFLTRDGKYRNQVKAPVAQPKPEKSLRLTLDATAPANAKEMIVELHTSWNTPGTILVDNFEIETLTPDGIPFSAFGKQQIAPRELYLNTPLIRNGEPVAAIIAATAEHRRIARTINAALRKKTGTELPVFDAALYADARKFDRHYLMLGNCDDNPAIEALYMRRMVILDSRYPGRGGWNVRTLHNPYADGHNVVFIGGSDPEGNRAAADVFLRQIAELPDARDLVLPRLAEIHYPKADQIKLGWGCEWDGGFSYDPISRDMAAFYMTGDRKYVDDMLRRMFPDAEQIKINNSIDRYDDGAEPIAKPYHYWGANMILYWDLIEEDPVFSPEVRLAITRKFYEQMQYWIHAGYGGWYRIYLNPKPHHKLHDRHYLMEALCVYTVARYFDKYYPGIDSAEGLRCVRRVFAPIWEAVTPQLGWRVWAPSFLFPAFQYAFMEDFQRCRTNVNVRKHAEYLLMLSSLRPGEWLNGYPGIYGALARIYDDAAYARMQSLFIRDPEAALIGPSYYTPGRTYRNDTLRRTAGKIVRSGVTGEKMDYENLPHDLDPATLDEFYSYRSRPDECGDYLLIAPKYRPGGRAGFYNFSIDELLLNGQQVLSGTNQLYPSANALFSGKPAWYARMRDAVKLNDAVWFSAVVPDFNEHDWERTLLFREKRGLLIFDRVRAKKDNLLYLENSWRPAPYTISSISPANDLVIDNPGALPPPGPETPVRFDGKKLFDAEFNGEKRYYEFSGATTFSDWTPDKTIRFPFRTEQEVEADFRLHFLGSKQSTGTLSVKLDGIPLGEKGFSMPENAEGVFVSYSPGRRKLHSGAHLLELTLADTEKADWQWTGLSATKTGANLPDGVFTIGCNLPTEIRLSPVLLTGPDGGTPVRGCAATFILTRPLKTGDTVEQISLLRPGRAEGPIAARAADGKTALRLPEPALITPQGNGFILLECAGLSGWQVCEVPGLFQRKQPVAFDYRAADRRLAIRETDGKITVSHPTGYQMPAPETIAAEVEKIFQNADKKNSKISLSAPALPPIRTIPLPAATGFMLSFGDRLAVASGRHLNVFAADGQRLWSAELPDDIGALHYWPTAKLLITGDRAENITAFSPDGERRWQTRSESAEGLIKSNKVYWFKGAYPGVYSLTDGELIAGQPRLFAGSTGSVEVLTPEGKTESRFWHEYGPVGSLALLPAEDDHTAEIFSARDFGGWPTVWGIREQEGKLITNCRWMLEDHRGQLMNSFGFSGVGKTFLRPFRFAPDEPTRLIGVFEGAQNRLAVWDFRGKVLAGVDLGAGEIASARNYAVPALSPRNVRGFDAAVGKDGEVRFAAATARRLFYLFDRTFQLRKLVELPGDPTLLLALPGTEPSFAVGVPGRVLIVDRDGTVIRQLPVTGRPTAGAAAAGRLWIGTDQNQLFVFEPNNQPRNHQ